MEYFVILLVAFGASMLTFFSGFGLGTLLTPAFLLFFPLPIAISLTAIVHFLNNLFKFGIIGSHINKKVLLNFGLPAVLGVIPGVLVLSSLEHSNEILHYSLYNSTYSITWMGVIIGLIMIVFSLSEFKTLTKDKPTHLKLAGGGLISGFFGGLSGHQGALRSGFLIRLNLSKEAFVATGVGISLFVDVTRIPMYYSAWMKDLGTQEWMMVVLAVIPAFLGAWLGKKWLKKTSVSFVRKTVGTLLIVFGLVLIFGIIG
jgi:uncharacterized membrane protein YfcA